MISEDPNRYQQLSKEPAVTSEMHKAGLEIEEAEETNREGDKQYSWLSGGRVKEAAAGGSSATCAIQLPTSARDLQPQKNNNSPRQAFTEEVSSRRR